MNRTSRSLLFVVAGVALLACGKPAREVPLRELQNRQFGAYIRPDWDDTLEIQVYLDYDHEADTCLKIPDDSRATVNGRRIKPVHFGYQARGGGCSGAYFAQRFPDLPPGDDAVVKLTDGETTLALVVNGFMKQPSIEIERPGGLVQGDYVGWVVFSSTDVTYETVYFHYFENMLTEEETPAFSITGDPDTSGQSLWVEANRIGFTVPATAPIGHGVLHASGYMLPNTIDTC